MRISLIAGAALCLLGAVPPAPQEPSLQTSPRLSQQLSLRSPQPSLQRSPQTSPRPSQQLALRSQQPSPQPSLQRSLRSQQPSQQPGQSDMLIPVVGGWSTVDDGGPAFKVDGASWDGVTSRARVDSLSRTLFGSVNEKFGANAVATGAFPLAVARNGGEVTNGNIKIRFKMVSGASDQNAGIVFGLRPTGDYYFARYNTKDGNVAVWQFVNGERKVLAHGEVHKQLPLNSWHELSVTITGAKVSSTITGSDMKVEHTFEAPVVGRVGVWTKRDAVTVFRDFRITR